MIAEHETAIIPYVAKANTHVADDALELHALGRTARNGEAAAIDERLLVCRERLDAKREYAAVMQRALKVVAAERRA